ncbi:hypothetical protein HU200_034538 [Digitaria exilis]|uniref:Uncharacterized protein n=1 Tax=Digitaria exilis TaxID=1010633 RepID=A0A835BJA0_9POAL|nr:hypothetical protein HU200_034538 [Digitaria exilis]
MQYGWNEVRDFGDEMVNMTPIWKDIYALLPSFRDETKVLLGNGKMTSFWLDLWCGSLPLANTFPALFSHVTRPNTSVAWVLSTPELLLSLRSRPTGAARRELLELQALVSPTMLDNDVSDARIFRHNQKPPYYQRTLHDQLQLSRAKQNIRTTVLTCVLWNV